MKAVESHPRYLGLPTIVGRSKAQVFAFVRDRVWKKLKGWKERTLSRAGREVLVKSVAQAIPTYIMGCFALPNNLCNQIESLISKFFWGGDVDKRKMHWLKWEKITRRKSKGGIGFRRIKDFNQALLAKQWWLLKTNPHSLLARTLKARYHPNCNVSEARLGYRPSYTWRSLFGAREVIDKGSSWRVGDGKQVKIWQDKWLPHKLNERPGQREQSSGRLTWVADLIEEDTHTWNVPLISSTFSQYEAEQILKIPLPVQAQQDKLMWIFSKNGLYSVKSGHHMLQTDLSEASPSESNSNLFWTNLWNVEIQPRCKELLWRAAHNSLPVKQNLNHRGVELDQTCPMCGDSTETMIHALLQCPEVKLIWFLSPLGLRIPEEEVSSFKFWLAHMMEQIPEEGLPWLFSIIWAIWKRRNLWLFENKRTPPEQVILQASRMHVPSRNPAPQPKRTQGLPSPPQTHWTAPQGNTIKANIDASIRENIGTGLGTIFRDLKGSCLVAACKFLPFDYEPDIAEALGLRWCLLLAKDLGVQELEIETDCLQLFQAWARTVPFNNYLASIVYECKALSSLFRNFRLINCRRTVNVVADFIAHMAFVYQDQVWSDFNPPGTSLLIHQDATLCNGCGVSTS